MNLMDSVIEMTWEKKTMGKKSKVFVLRRDEQEPHKAGIFWLMNSSMNAHL